MDPPPPPPPPHGDSNNKRGGLPDGNYDIFIIPPHSAGSGFLYLPSLQPHRNSFLAGVGVTLLAVAIWVIVFPVLREWLATIVASGGMGVVLLMVGMGVAGWAWGKTQMEDTARPEGGGNAGSSKQGPMPGPPPPHEPPPQQNGPGVPPYSASGAAGATGAGPERPKPTWTRSTPAGGAGASSGAKTAWEKAREETRKKEEDRKKMDELRKKREDAEKERVKQREREAREREIRELREAREKREREAKAARERMSQSQTQSRPASPTKGRHQQPSARTEADEEETYSFRPYDKPKTSPTKSTGTSSIYSSSYAPSQSTARSTPPPSHRGPYHTKDPDKIVLKAVYSFNNTFMKMPIAQLVSGVGAVTDGLILRITTEGLFIDDDVRGVPQREWDVKAWTMKLVEVSFGKQYTRISVLRF